MQIDTTGVDPALLLGELNQAYGLGLIALRFLPKGEEAYHYIATDRSGARHFVKLQGTGRAPHFALGLEIAAALHDTHRLQQVVAARRTHTGGLSVAIEGYRVAVFPFFAGASGYEEAFSDDERAEAVRLVAAVHGCTEPLTESALPRIGFEDEFAARIMRSLADAATSAPGGESYPGRVRALLLAEQDDLLDELVTLRDLARQARAAMRRPVLTHGDPNDANLIRGDDGRIHLVDWSEPALGPRERDLAAFIDQRFEQAIREYLAVTGPVPLYTATFAYYAHRWVVQEIADYTTRILVTNTDPAEDEGAWERLAPYLPLPHDSVARTVQQVEAVLRRFGLPA